MKGDEINIWLLVQMWVIYCKVRNKDSTKNSKEDIALRVQLCKDKIGSSPLQTEMCKPKCYTLFLWCKVTR